MQLVFKFLLNLAFKRFFKYKKSGFNKIHECKRRWKHLLRYLLTKFVCHHHSSTFSTQSSFHREIFRCFTDSQQTSVERDNARKDQQVIKQPAILKGEY